MRCWGILGCWGGNLINCGNFCLPTTSLGISCHYDSQLWDGAEGFPPQVENYFYSVRKNVFEYDDVGALRASFRQLGTQQTAGIWWIWWMMWMVDLIWGDGHSAQDRVWPATSCLVGPRWRHPVRQCAAAEWLSGVFGEGLIWFNRWPLDYLRLS